MQRSKQQALMFLLGAVIVGGVLGFSAERVIGHGHGQSSWAQRTTMYDDLELTAGQRAAMDSIMDDRNRRVDSLLRPVRSQIDSVRANARTQFYRVFTADQRLKFEARVREDSIRRAEAHKSREQKRK